MIDLFPGLVTLTQMKSKERFYFLDNCISVKASTDKVVNSALFCIKNDFNSSFFNLTKSVSFLRRGTEAESILQRATPSSRCCASSHLAPAVSPLKIPLLHSNWKIGRSRCEKRLCVCAWHRSGENIEHVDTEDKRTNGRRTSTSVLVLRGSWIVGCLSHTAKGKVPFCGHGHCSLTQFLCFFNFGLSPSSRPALEQSRQHLQTPKH